MRDACEVRLADLEEKFSSCIPGIVEQCFADSFVPALHDILQRNRDSISDDLYSVKSRLAAVEEVAGDLCLQESYVIDLSTPPRITMSASRVVVFFALTLAAPGNSTYIHKTSVSAISITY